ncbi:helix-turn-helix transcriptional regulator [Sandaracinobacter neustonicus]|uniref:Helix-turn-helix transcriptional regulator n=1 Tax=Sandaracinobacter neustonicus TaxID=1715348 RepID=A0A501XLA3_9SPHN|nr:helix-turn-helix transcriptional regulator [Sandaracinobacter neustonicus]TPE61054.1 helix-turn-helix transcriptional regulator [Sandaracinobacter neustonicus]
MADVDLAARVARLTAGQRECLDLVDDHATSKEIARQLGISRHTVDARLRGAIQTLGVSSRREAAIIYRAAMQAEAYQPFAYQSSRIVTELPEPENAGHDADDEPDESTLAAPAAAAAHAVPQPAVGVVSDSAVWTAVPSHGLPLRQPALRLWGGSNDLSPSQRVVGILVVTILAMLAFGVFLTGIEALSLLRS